MDKRQAQQLFATPPIEKAPVTDLMAFLAYQAPYGYGFLDQYAKPLS
jgi:hypothetical protein